MQIETIRLSNFRKLRDVKIDLAQDISIFVGANNSGKTSASHALQMFLSASRERFSLHDFSMHTWDTIDEFGRGTTGAEMPAITLDLWFKVQDTHLHRVIDILPTLDWEGTSVGMRIQFAPIDAATMFANFTNAYTRAQAHIQLDDAGAVVFHPPPRTMREYLADNLRKEYELQYFVLDRSQFDENLQARDGYTPFRLLPDKGRSGKDVLNSLLRVDVLHAQRHLSDSSGGTRAEELSRVLSRFYERNLEKSAEDFDAIRALTQSESLLNSHLERVFGPTLQRLAKLGYPGLSNPKLLIKTALNPTTVMGSHDGTHVHYALRDGEDGIEPPTLPDRYNGLGFKNLIYMVVELLDLHAQWLDIDENRPPLHLIFIEEPEAHLHAQLQQVFIRKVIDILQLENEDARHYFNQLVITTHSPHILYERGFQPIRYFRRQADSAEQISEVLNLSTFHQNTAEPVRGFLERYLKLTHCDLFFADAAILVEGNVERLLMPQMIAKAAPNLQSAYLTILEIGGAFGHRFKSLIEFLGITALIVTDIDSVRGSGGPTNVADEGDANTPLDRSLEAIALVDEEGQPKQETALPSIDPVRELTQSTELNSTEADSDNELADEGKDACMVGQPGAVTSNQTLIQWLPGKTTIAELLAATEVDRTQNRTNPGNPLVRVTYQTVRPVTWRTQTLELCGRTLEEAFALENLTWSQDGLRRDLGLRVRGGQSLELTEIAERLFKKVNAPGFKKTDFALALLGYDPTLWTVPAYISEGLEWLEGEIIPASELAHRGDKPAEPAHD